MFELNEEMLNNLDESKMKLEELKHLWENKEFKNMLNHAPACTSCCPFNARHSDS